jgi:hypothetical protein
MFWPACTATEKEEEEEDCLLCSKNAVLLVFFTEWNSGFSKNEHLVENET